ncbi:MAG TPA: putative ABC exporter domain-containing protein [Gemmatimonadaceae bacterium]|nr:putative ABC exporter domain-containing protein [Gemmatimonadaceae bacterium]
MSARALSFLAARSARNRVTSVVTQMRSPRYALTVLAGVSYVALVIGDPSHWNRHHSPFASSGLIQTLAPLGVALLVAWWWIRGGYQRAIAFAPAEVDFLFPAPVRRRTLIVFKMLRVQPGIIFTAAFILFVFPWTMALWWPLAFLSLWLVLTALNWHQLAASLVRANVAEHTGTSAAARRSMLPLLIAVLALAALLSGLVPDLFALRGATSVHEVMTRLIAALHRPAPRVVLYPFRLLLAPVLALDVTAWLHALPGLLVILALHFAWVIRSDAAFEEAAAEGGRKRAEMLANRKKGLARYRRPATKPATRPLFELNATGWPGAAMLWKSMLEFTRGFRPRVVIGMAAAIGVLLVMLLYSTHGGSSGADTAAGLLAGVLAITTLMAPIGLRNDLRGDLRHIELLRTFPIRGRDLVAGEISGATLSVAMIQAVLLIVALVFAMRGSVGATHRGLIALAAVLGLPLLVTITAGQCTILNAMALIVPAWVRTTADVGIEATGQRLLVMAGSIVLLLLALVPAALLGGVAFAIAAGLAGTRIAGIAAGVVLCAALWGEIVGAWFWLGHLYDRLDPVEVGIIA